MSEKIKIPDLLSKDFFKKSIENGLKISNVEIKDIDITNGSSGGENYCSIIYRCKINYIHNNTVKKISLIVKYMEFDGEKYLLKEMGVYGQEKNMYLEVVPALEELLGEDIRLAPKCFYAVESDVAAIVFQDMNEEEYAVADRINGLDESSINILLEKIAKFHAASMVLAEKNPELVKSFSRSFFHSVGESAAKDAVFVGNLDYIADVVCKKWPEFDSIADKIRNIKKNFTEISLKTVAATDKTIAVLNHGDLWVNNMMFKKNKGTVSDVVFVDLQLSYYGSLGYDLHYFLNTSVPTELLKTKRYDFLRWYYHNFKKTLVRLNYKKIPTWEEFKDEIRAMEFYGFFAYESILPIVSLDREASKENSIDNFANEEYTQKNREIVFNSKRMVEMSKYSLDRFDELGALDFWFY